MATILTTWTLWMVQQKWRHSGSSRSFFPAFGNFYRIFSLLTLVIQSIPWAGGQGESAVRQCNAAVGSLEPEVSFYMTELYHRMILNDNEEEDGGKQWEKIAAIKKLNSPQQYLRFNISTFSQSDNVTSARVALITRDERNSCKPILRETRRSDILPCENRPFQIEGLATVDVTSVLRRQLGQQQLQIYSQRVQNLHSASLIVFTGIDTAQLFADNRALVCGSVMRRKREADMDTLAQSKQADTEKRMPTAMLGRRKREQLPAERTLRLETPSAIKQKLAQMRKRNVNDSLSPYRCEVVPWVLDPVEDLRMNMFISPLTMDLGRCVGSCPPVLLLINSVSIYTYIKSLLYFIHPNNPWPVPAPRCQPTRFQPFSVLRFTNDDILVLERWRNAKITKCRCV